MMAMVITCGVVLVVVIAGMIIDTLRELAKLRRISVDIAQLQADIAAERRKPIVNYNNPAVWADSFVRVKGIHF